MTAIDATSADAPTPGEATRSTARVVGYDLARCLAFFGMVVVNYRYVMGGFTGSPDWLVASMDAVTLRAAATFVMLAGVGMTLLLRANRNAGRPNHWTDPLRSIALVTVVAAAWLLVDFFAIESAAERPVNFGPLGGMGMASIASGDVEGLDTRLASHVQAVTEGSFSTFLTVGMGICSALLIAFLALGRRMRMPRAVLLKRVLFLGALGMVWLPLWGGDILRFYALYLLAGVCVLTLRATWILGVAIAIMVAAFWWQFAESGGVTSEAFASRGNLWTIEAMSRQLFLGGFHPVLPWLAFLLVGILIGRLDVNSWRSKLGLLALGLTLAISGYAGAGPLGEWLIGDPGPKVEHHAPNFELEVAASERRSNGARRGARVGAPRRSGAPGSTASSIALQVPDDFDREANADFLAGVEELRKMFAGRGSFGERSMRVVDVERGGATRQAVVLTISYGEDKPAPADHHRQLERLRQGVKRWVRSARNARLAAAAEETAAAPEPTPPVESDSEPDSEPDEPASGQSEQTEPPDQQEPAEPNPPPRWRRSRNWPEAVGLLAIERRMLASPSDGSADAEPMIWDTHWVDTAALANPTPGARWAKLVNPFGSKSGPGYMCTAMGISMSVIALSLLLTSFGLMRRLLRPLVVAGQMALTLYVGHVVVGFSIAGLIGKLSGENLTFIAFYISIACLAAVAFANWWRAHWQRGPLESVMRWMTG